MVKKIVLAQYQEIVNSAAKHIAPINRPLEGWVCTVRKSLNMSGAQLARRLGVTRARISHAEKAEISGALTLNTMHEMAKAMNCQFVYAIIPNQNIETLIGRQAIEKATSLVRNASNHMALESQTLSKGQIHDEIDRVSKELLARMPSDFWDK
jgi:predicted DNA-binding mobile mystery protein A